MDTRDELIARLNAVEEERRAIIRQLRDMDTAQWMAYIRAPGTTDLVAIGGYATRAEGVAAIEAALNTIPDYQGKWKNNQNVQWVNARQWEQKVWAKLEPVGTDGAPVSLRWE